jgi:hypothetical protein
MRRTITNQLQRLGAIVFVAVVACNDDSAEDGCYELDPMLEYTPPFIPHCEWRPGELPEPASGYDNAWPITVTFVPTEDEPCDPCDTERLDARLKAKIEEVCDQPYGGFTRACYEPPDASDDRCTIRAVYSSDCLAPEVE